MFYSISVQNEYLGDWIFPIKPESLCVNIFFFGAPKCQATAACTSNCNSIRMKNKKLIVIQNVVEYLSNIVLVRVG